MQILQRLRNLHKDNFDLSPRGIRELLSLNKPIYEDNIVIHGHFGRKPSNEKVNFHGKKLTKFHFFKKL